MLKIRACKLVRGARKALKPSLKRGAAGVSDPYSLPPPENEPVLNFAPGSPERSKLLAALKDLREKYEAGPIRLPLIINGEEIFTKDVTAHKIPFDHKYSLCEVSCASSDNIKAAIDSGMKARNEWDNMCFGERSAIFLKAADLLTTKYRYDIAAATMIGQGKNIIQAEVDCVAESADFLRFYVDYARNLHKLQPYFHDPGTWNRIFLRGLEGFVYVVSPFNFTAIGVGLCAAPGVMGNVVISKPSTKSAYSNYIVTKILHEAGMPPGVLNFITGEPEKITNALLSSPHFGGIHFTGGTSIFDGIWTKIGQNISNYKSYPRIVGETGGKNMHFIHNSADMTNVVSQTIRSAFEYTGQKCSACSRVYVPESIWEEFKTLLCEEISKIKVGDVYDPKTFVSAVIDERSYDKILGHINRVGTKHDLDTKIIVTGDHSKEHGYYIYPTLLQTTNMKSPTMVEEIFGPVLTAYVYKDSEFESTLEFAANQTTPYALTGSIFATDINAIKKARAILRNSAGNFYVNDKSTGAVVSRQPFGGARKSGTNDKAGGIFNLVRWASPLVVKTNFRNLGKDWTYLSNKE